MMLEILLDCPDKTLPFVMPVEGRLIAVCTKDSGLIEDGEGKGAFVVMPCFGHHKVEPIEFDVNADDFKENLN